MKPDIEQDVQLSVVPEHSEHSAVSTHRVECDGPSAEGPQSTQQYQVLDSRATACLHCAGWVRLICMHLS